ncbi:hypothetical protein FSG04_011725, partial [Escherichia coli]|nr:hypothetical protein [Escherichia coli]
STSKTPSYTKSVSWQHHLGAVSIVVAIAIATIGIETKGVSVESLSIDAVANK